MLQIHVVIKFPFGHFFECVVEYPNTNSFVSLFSLTISGFEYMSGLWWYLATM